MFVKNVVFLTPKCQKMIQNVQNLRYLLKSCFFDTQISKNDSKHEKFKIFAEKLFFWHLNAKNNSKHVKFKMFAKKLSFWHLNVEKGSFSIPLMFL